MPVITPGGVHIRLEGLDRVLRDLEVMAGNGANMTEIHNAVALMVRGWQLRHFTAAVDSRGIPWRPLSPLTLALRRGGGGLPLQDTGALKASVGVQAASSTGWTVGTRKKYAAVHQFGATILPKNGKFLFIPVDKFGRRARSFASSVEMGGAKGQQYGKLTKSGKAKRRLIALKKAVIPAREYLYLNTQEQEELVEVYASEAASRGTTYIQWMGLRRARA